MKKAQKIIIFVAIFALAVSGAFADKLGDKKKSLEYFKEAEAEYEKGDLETAIEKYEKCADLDPENGDALFNVGACYVELNDEEKALKYFKDTLDVDPDHSGAHYNIGRLFHLRRDFDTAILEYRRALKREPYATDIMFNLAMAQSGKGDVEDAIETWNRYLDLAEADPTEAEWYERAKAQRDSLMELLEVQPETPEGE
ncbi:MAG: tetratricopeptide repeat protein [bacterium]|nr:tetratricopeptide repeat protein [bacterium]